MKEKGIKIMFSVFLFASLLMPFSVSAESVGGSSPIIGVNITYIGYDGEVVPYQSTVRFDTEQTMWRCTSSHSTMGCQVWESITSSGSDLDEITGTITTNATSTYTYRLYQYEFIFDKSYVGSITFSGNHPGATTTTTYYVNGDRLVLTDINLVTSFTIGSYNLTYAPLEVIDRMRNFNIYFESYPYVYYFLNSHYSEYEDIQTYYNLNYPSFKILQGASLTHTPTNSARFYIICMLNRWVTSSNFSTIFTTNYTVENFRLINSGQLNTYYFELVRPSGSPNLTFEYAYSNYGLYVPIYFNNQINNLTTDFALSFGLSNSLLNTLNIIANGTAESSSSSSSLESSNSDMASDMNSMATIENGYSQDFNSQLQNIDFTNPIQQNQGILPAANFVISIFNGLISNNPFTVLIIIVCILLIGKKVIGK